VKLELRVIDGGQQQDLERPLAEALAESAEEAGSLHAA
jgi:hypothetical protein